MQLKQETAFQQWWSGTFLLRLAYRRSKTWLMRSWVESILACRASMAFCRPSTLGSSSAFFWAKVSISCWAVLVRPWMYKMVDYMQYAYIF